MSNQLPLVVALMLVLGTESLKAVAPTEPMIRDIVVNYQNGNSIRLECDSDRFCKTVVISIAGEEFQFLWDERQMNIDSYRPTLFLENTKGVEFAFQVRMLCPQETEVRGAICYATFAVKAGEIVGGEAYMETGESVHSLELPRPVPVLDHDAEQ